MDVTAASRPDLANTSRSGASPPAEGSGGLVSGDFQLFLKMLTAQIRNQDPLNPIEGSDYAVQLATFSGVEQQVRTNSLLSALSTQLGMTSLGQYATWVGMEARSAAPAVFDGAPLTLFAESAEGAARAYLVTYDSRDREVMRQEVPTGDAPIQWSGASLNGGQVLAGTYGFRLESHDANGARIAESPVETFTRLTEVRQTPVGPLLVTESGATVSPSDISALRPPATP
jgi:flagellar basal-body rod modification protein FlgD